MSSVNGLVRAVTSRLPLHGLPVVFDPFSPVFFRSPAPAHLQVGDISLQLDLSNRVMRTMYYGIFEKDLLGYMRSLLRPGDTFVDVGANIGYVSAFARQLVGPFGMVHSFEPVLEYATVLEAAVRASGVKNIKVVRQAASDREGTAPIMINGSDNIGWNTIVPGFMQERNSARTAEVPLTTLTCYFEKIGVSDVRLIKIDVEGAELLVLRGLIPWLAEGKRPCIVTELCPKACALLGSSAAEVFALMEGYGYRAFVFSRRGLRKVYAGQVRLDPVTPQMITKTTDIVWEVR
jgi:FkbM family methyltransferase